MIDVEETARRIQQERRNRWKYLLLGSVLFPPMLLVVAGMFLMGLIKHEGKTNG